MQALLHCVGAQALLHQPAIHSPHDLRLSLVDQELLRCVFRRADQPVTVRGVAPVDPALSGREQPPTPIGAVLTGTAGQGCRVDQMCDALPPVPKAEQQLVAATNRTAFAQPTPELVREHWRRVADTFRGRYPRLARLMDDSQEDVLAYRHYPHERSASAPGG